jgi:hypothetical protein
LFLLAKPVFASFSEAIQWLFVLQFKAGFIASLHSQRQLFTQFHLFLLAQAVFASFSEAIQWLFVL